MLIVALGAAALGVRWLAQLLEAHSRSEYGTIEAFFEAQREGDCGRVRTLMTRASWSNDGEWTAQEFVDRCSNVVDGFRLRPGTEYGPEFRVEKAGDGKAIVEFSPRSWSTGSDSEDVLYPDVRARVLEEDGVWKIQPGGLVRVGVDPLQVVQTFLDAYRDGDCERMAAQVVDDDSADTEYQKDGFLARCAKEAGGGGPRLRVGATVMDLQRESDDTISFEIEASKPDQVGGFDERITLEYREDLGWRLVPSPGARWVLGAVDAHQLGMTVVQGKDLPQSVKVGGESGEALDVGNAAAAPFTRAEDAEPVLRKSGFVAAYRRSWEHDHQALNVAILRFTRPGGAKEYVRYYSGAVSTLVEHPTDLPGIPDSYSFDNINDRDITGVPDRVFSAVVRGDMVVIVYAENLAEGQIIDYASQVMTAQLKRVQH